MWGQTSRAALFVRYFFSLRDKETSLKLGNAYLSCLELDFFFVVVFIFILKENCWPKLVEARDEGPIGKISIPKIMLEINYWKLHN